MGMRISVRHSESQMVQDGRSWTRRLTVVNYIITIGFGCYDPGRLRYQWRTKEMELRTEKGK